MCKLPVAGRVKTRLAGAVGVSRATGFARASSAALLARVTRDPRWQTLLCVTPDAAVHSRAWPERPPRIPQGAGGLGDRMQRIFVRLPPGPVVIVGTDIPGIRPDEIARAFRLLGAADAVFGPAADGGYWLIGMRRRPRLLRPFDRVRWSSLHALADTLANLEGAAVRTLATLEDVDDAATLSRHAVIAGRRVHPAGSSVEFGEVTKSGGN